MFESFVIGPVMGANGLIRKCVECRAASADYRFKCSGFGPGCIAATGRREAAYQATKSTIAA